jgi:outer membrane protein OmpA-like peptidoglycan-associated protein
MRDLIHRAGFIGGAAGVAVLVAGCGLSSVGAPGGQTTSSGVTITQHVAPSALLAVTTGPASGPALAGLVAGTARPSEDVTILQAGTPAKTIVVSDSPAPTTIVIPGPPTAPPGGATEFQSAQYTKKLGAYRAKRAAAVQAEAAETRERISAWLNGLEIPQKISRLADPPADEGCVGIASAVAAGALADLQEEAGDIFGNRRVLVFFCNDLSGAVPAGELSGDDVIVVTGSLPLEAAASAAQAGLLTAGATQATVVGSAVTAARLSALVSADLSQGAGPGDSVSTAVLFGNASYALSAGAVRELTRLLPRLRKPGATAVINGFASTPGTAEANYVLSYQRADAVAGFFEAHGISPPSLIIVGHGATDLVGSGASGANRRVLVVIEEPAGLWLLRWAPGRDGEVGPGALYFAFLGQRPRVSAR